MNQFNNFQHYEEVFQSLKSIKDVYRLCNTNRQAAAFCQSMRGTQIIKNIREREALDFYLNNPYSPHVKSFFQRELDKPQSKFGTREELLMLQNIYQDFLIDAAVNIVKRYPEYHSEMFNLLKAKHNYIPTGTGIDKHETRYTPVINNIINLLYDFEYDHADELLIEYLMDSAPHLAHDPAMGSDLYDQIDLVTLEFLKLYPEILFYINKNFKDYNVTPFNE